jgi:hypothetical protein
MNILYYSNFCPHSKLVIQFIAKNNLTNNLNCICIDKRVRLPNTNQIKIVLENGKQVSMPPNVHSVPALLLVKQNYNVILGNNIIEYLKPTIQEKTNIATNNQGEPIGYYIQNSNNGMNIVSETYTNYNMSPDELSTKGNGENRQMYSYVKADYDEVSIYTPPDNYRPDKLSNHITVDSLQQKRNDEIAINSKNSL